MQVPWAAIVTVILYIIASTVGFIWWMATQTIMLQFLKEDMAKVTALLNNHDEKYATKIDVAKDFVFRDQRIDAAWKKLDTLI